MTDTLTVAIFGVLLQPTDYEQTKISRHAGVRVPHILRTKNSFQNIFVHIHRLTITFVMNKAVPVR